MDAYPVVTGPASPVISSPAQPVISGAIHPVVLGVPGPPGKGGTGTGAAEQKTYDSSIVEDRTPTLPDPTTVPDQELILTHWRGSAGDYTVGITNAIDGIPGPAYINKGASVRVKSSLNETTSTYEWTKLSASVLSIIDPYRFADNVIPINDVTELPVPLDLEDGLGLAYRLESGKEYFIGGDLVLDYPFVVTANTTIRSITGVNIVYTGSGALFRNNATTQLTDTFSTCSVNFVGTGVNQAFSILDSNSGSLEINDTSFINFDMGIIQVDLALFLDKTVIVQQKGKLLFDNLNILAIDRTLIDPQGVIGDSLIEITGNTIAEVTGSIIVPYGGDSFININPAFEGRFQFDHNNFFTVAGGVAFKSGSLDQTDIHVSVIAVSNVPDSQLIGSYFMRRNTVDTEISAKGEDALFTAVEDAGGGKSRILTGTTPDDGSVVWLINGIYSGKYTTSNTVIDVSFEIVKEFSSTDTGEWHTGWTKIAGTTIPDTNERVEMSNNNELTFLNIERSSVTVKSTVIGKNSGVASAKGWELVIMLNGAILLGSLRSATLTNNASTITMEAPAQVKSGDVAVVYTRNLTDSVNFIAENLNTIAK